jgi:type I restriction enzyme, S subunit
MKLVPLGSVAEIQLGKMLSPKAKVGNHFSPYLRNRNVQWGHFDLTDIAQMAFSEKEKAKFELRSGDLLVCEGGEPGRCAVWTGQAAECYYQKAIHRVRPDPKVADPDFLSLWIRYQAATGAFEDQNAKTTIAHLPLVRLRQLLVPMLPLDEQRLTASRVKMQLAACENARTAARLQISEARQLPTAVLRELFRPVVGAKMVSIADIATTTSGTTPSRDRQEYWTPPGYPWIKTGEIGFKPITQAQEWVSEVATNVCSLPILPAGTVLIAMYGQGKTRGQSAVLEIEATTNQACFAILPNADVDPYYLQLWLRLSYTSLRGLSDARGGNQANLNGEMLRALKIPLLPLAEQKEIVNRALPALREIDRLDERLRVSSQEMDLLPRRLLATAFEVGR